VKARLKDPAGTPVRVNVPSLPTEVESAGADTTEITRWPRSDPEPDDETTSAADALELLAPTTDPLTVTLPPEDGPDGLSLPTPQPARINSMTNRAVSVARERTDERMGFI
jgi:hypothetical protein